MQGWGELVLQGPIRENGETVEPREPRPALRPPSLQDNGELHDPEVQALLRRAEAGERILAPDVTEEERRMLRRRSAARLRILTCETMSDPQKNECTMNWNRDYG